MEYIETCSIHPNDLKKIENYLEKKGLYLYKISNSINGFAIAHVSLIEAPEDIETQREFDIVINLQKMICCKFYFYGHRTDGLRIYNQPKNCKLKIFNPNFNISFINTVSGRSTPYILITYTDLYYDTCFDDGNYGGKIYATIMDFSEHENFTAYISRKNYNNRAIFKFDDFFHYNNSVKVYLIDEKKYPGLFAYYLISDSEGYDENYYEYNILKHGKFDGIWNNTIWCTNKKIIPLKNESIYEEADQIMEEIREEQEDSLDDYDYNYENEDE